MDYLISWQSLAIRLLNGAQSDLMPTSQGVPQGSVIGPTPFLLYINDLFAQLPSNCIEAYGDDVTLLTAGTR